MPRCPECGCIMTRIIDKNGNETYECSNPNCPSK
jgi:hypothetical protein